MAEMEMKTDIILPIPPQQAAEPKAPSAAGKTAVPAAKEAGGGAKAPDVAAIQEVLREALNVEPVAERELRIEFENELNQIVVKVLDKDTGELVRQIPMPEEISIAKGLRAAIRRMAGDQSGIAVDREV
jgi:uncharacterized FlaG/YvyC family protein